MHRLGLKLGNNGPLCISWLSSGIRNQAGVSRIWWAHGDEIAQDGEVGCKQLASFRFFDEPCSAGCLSGMIQNLTSFATQNTTAEVYPHRTQKWAKLAISRLYDAYLTGALACRTPLGAAESWAVRHLLNFRNCWFPIGFVFSIEHLCCCLKISKNKVTIFVLVALGVSIVC